MSATLLDAPNVRTTSENSPAENLRISNAAVRVSVRWLGVRKTLTPEQRNQAAEPFDATGDFLSARKKLLDTKHAAYKALTAVRGKVITHWKTMTLPYPEPGLRLIKQSRIQAFDQQMADFRTELNTAVATLELSYPALQAAARQRLGSLYNANDYPATLEGLFGIDWDYPSVEPPDYLMQLNPEIYERERSRVAARFEEAVELAEQAFLSEFAKLVSHLTERLGSEENGDRKIFRDTV